MKTANTPHNKNYSNFGALSVLQFEANKEIDKLKSGFKAFKGVDNFLMALGTHALNDNVKTMEKNNIQELPEGSFVKLENKTFDLPEDKNFYFLKNTQYHAFEVKEVPRIEDKSYIALQNIVTKNKRDSKEKIKYNALKDAGLIVKEALNRDDLINLFVEIFESDEYLSEKFLQENKENPTREYFENLSFYEMIDQVEKSQGSSYWSELKSGFYETPKETVIFNLDNHTFDSQPDIFSTEHTPKQKSTIFDNATIEQKKIKLTLEKLKKEIEVISYMQDKSTPLKTLAFSEEKLQEALKIKKIIDSTLAPYSLGMHGDEIRNYNNSNKLNDIRIETTRELTKRHGRGAHIPSWAFIDKLADKNTVEKTLYDTNKYPDLQHSLIILPKLTIEIKDYGISDNEETMISRLSGKEGFLKKRLERTTKKRVEKNNDEEKNKSLFDMQP